MPNLKDLQAQKVAIEAEIKAAKSEAAKGILAQMAALGLTLEDLGGTRAGPTSGTGAKRPVKYRDQGGNTWTGVGQRPRWLRAAILGGATLESFAVKG